MVSFRIFSKRTPFSSCRLVVVDMSLGNRSDRRLDGYGHHWTGGSLANLTPSRTLSLSFEQRPKSFFSFSLSEYHHNRLPKTPRMKVAQFTLILASICCASSFGLNGKANVMRKVGFAGVGHNKPMVQAIDTQGSRLGSSTMVSLTLSRRLRAL